jgi:hypothetical protein
VSRCMSLQQLQQVATIPENPPGSAVKSSYCRYPPTAIA